MNVIGDVDRFFAHDLGKDLVDGRKHLCPTAEVLGHRHEFSLRAVSAVCLVGMLKERRIGKTKPIDTLLHVTDNEAVVFACNLPQNALLQSVRILIFVHHDCVVMGTQLIGNLRRCGNGRILLQLLRIATEQFECRMYKVDEIEDAALEFFLLIRIVKCCCQANVLTDGGICSILGIA